MEEGGSASGIRYLHSCRQDDSIIPLQNLHNGFEGFVFHLRFCNKIEKANGDKALVLNSFKRFFSQYRRASLEDDMKGIEFALYVELSDVNIPNRVKYSVIDEVVSFAGSMVEEKDAHHNTEEEEAKKKKKVFPIFVDMVVKNLQRPSESDPEAISRALSESLDGMIGDVKIPPCMDERSEFIESFIAYQTALAEKSSRPVPDIGRMNAEEVASTKPSICSLEYTRADDSFCSDDECCEICWRSFSCGMVVTRLPCSPHPYHGDCLVHLLMSGDSIPRCDYLPHCR